MSIDKDLNNLLQDVDAALRQQAQSATAGPAQLRATLLTAYVIRSRLNLRAIAELSKGGLYSECAPLLRAQLEMRLATLLLSSGLADEAVAWLIWHDELRRRLKFVKLEHLESEAAHMSAVLTQTKTTEDNQLLTDWYKQKPTSAPDDAAWLNHWPLWPLEKLLNEIQKNLIEDPRLRKELDNLSNFVFENPPGAGITATKRYALLDDDLGAVTFVDTGEIHWPEGPLALATAATVDMLYEIALAYSLPFAKAIDAYRLGMKKHEF